jgi:MYXO-CTERM domain-containing protein
LADASVGQIHLEGDVHMRFGLSIAGLMAAAAVMSASTASGDTIQITSNNAASSNGLAGSYGGFTGSVTYDFLGGTSARLSITLTNTSQFSGELVAIAFDDAVGTGDWLFHMGDSSIPHNNWFDISGHINTAPFGQREHGVSIHQGSAAWEGGGNPHPGIHAGETATWVFTGTGTASVSAADFLSPNGGQNLVVRFRGFSNGASDKLPAMASTGNPPPVPGIAGIAVLAGVGSLRRRRR